MLAVSILPLRLSSLLPLAPGSILVSMSTLDTEPGCDFLYLSVKSSDGVEIPLIRSNSRDGTKTFSGVSGRNMIVRGTVSFTTKSETFSVSLRFTSDEATAFAGATINSLTVSAA
ncbi:hypothetical protein BASA50_002485 [Batrachochytrium salamandrivorans]|uniref:Secreted protein n=1 Tax=Batrachochytrium salamandrivorans TaxID=1357716 RepID=A0ABQ8FL76_9FUNG|nr:hypothetical protein BASA50_002485 [Batrachochytrium salamandrivorans]